MADRPHILTGFHFTKPTLAAFEERLENSAEEERRTVVEQINRIALFRLQARAEQQ